LLIMANSDTTSSSSNASDNTSNNTSNNISNNTSNNISDNAPEIQSEPNSNTRVDSSLPAVAPVAHTGGSCSAASPASDLSDSETSATLQGTRTPLEISALTERRELRLSMRARRRRLSRGQQRLAAQRLARRATRQSWYIRARSLALYLAADGEIDPQVLIGRALADGKRIFLPQLRAGNRLGFAEYRRGARLRRNRFGIPEPLRGRQVALRELDVVLMPLVAFDGRGNRLGMGGGFYDRTFARLRQPYCSGANAPRLIGLAHGFQQVAGLVQQSWDVPLNGTLTDNGWIAVR
jgi:5-formyltetrahydrofolate cyclo-ligase